MEKTVVEENRREAPPKAFDRPENVKFIGGRSAGGDRLLNHVERPTGHLKSGPRARGVQRFLRHRGQARGIEKMMSQFVGKGRQGVDLNGRAGL